MLLETTHFLKNRFNSTDKAVMWICRENPNFEGKRPVDLITDGHGEAVLAHIAAGKNIEFEEFKIAWEKLEKEAKQCGISLNDRC